MVCLTDVLLSTKNLALEWLKEELILIQVQRILSSFLLYLLHQLCLLQGEISWVEDSLLHLSEHTGIRPLSNPCLHEVFLDNHLGFLGLDRCTGDDPGSVLHYHDYLTGSIARI